MGAGDGAFLGELNWMLSQKLNIGADVGVVNPRGSPQSFDGRKGVRYRIVLIILAMHVADSENSLPGGLR